jgi:hypothetical protein
MEYPGIHCPINLPAWTWADAFEFEPIILVPPYVGDDQNERGERIGGWSQCPKCGVWWPIVEEPDMWTESDDGTHWVAEGWWGAAVCMDCGMLMVDQPDGTGECYEL